MHFSENWNGSIFRTQLRVSGTIYKGDKRKKNKPGNLIEVLQRIDFFPLSKPFLSVLAESYQFFFPPQFPTYLSNFTAFIVVAASSSSTSLQFCSSMPFALSRKCKIRSRIFSSRARSSASLSVFVSASVSGSTPAFAVFPSAFSLGMHIQSRREAMSAKYPLQIGTAFFRDFLSSKTVKRVNLRGEWPFWRFFPRLCDARERRHIEASFCNP